MHRQEIQIEPRNAAHGGLDRGPDVEQLHVQEDALALFLLQFVGQGQAPAGQHPQPDLVKAGGIADACGKLQPLDHVRHVQRHNQAVICGHLGVPFCLRDAAAGHGLSSSTAIPPFPRPHSGAMPWHKRGDVMILCFDIGGSRIKAGRAGADGVVVPLGAVPTPLRDFAAFARALSGFAGDWTQGISISIAGVVDPDSGRIKVANIPCLNGRTLAAELGRALGRPIWVFNDADCFALAEAGMGAGRGHRNVFGVILGTGVGGGLVIDGRIITGAGGYAGEWGHGPVANAALAPWFPCGCGLSGCLDTVGGARGMERLHLHLHGIDTGSVAVLQAWQAGDAAAAQTVILWRDLLAGPLAMVLNVVGSSIVPVGGGLANVPALIALLDGAVRANLLRSTNHPLLVPAALTVEPGLVGAALAGIAELSHG